MGMISRDSIPLLNDEITIAKGHFNRLITKLCASGHFKVQLKDFVVCEHKNKTCFLKNVRDENDVFVKEVYES
eukprot:CAMPEP_0116898196 /NCGR_PEP_ID=MMETSP0467-20121206/6957_1 /TAXON_ID=283647 /ORGANISM="Mesodinium pulex, Strain SPMC105" /LENGTH=72 /DNA_ID=CAMNT_0004570159 /DNA_START=159 /DNA_END=380 /DNA_ORIENTATION=-